ncbi:Aspartate aminotransferase, mitochondrial [Smittium mucronatum]|uniref:Aspartate aminotransferase n=1 Tax=Smittium mucronatum TaxID=133383 RepID=A0A1R0H3H2_9FUNG|nr:Aspartate aminotransferase, mitochondrial [Smittium mucronatum]
MLSGSLKTLRFSRNNVSFKPALRHITAWANVPMGPPDPILGVVEAFKKDTSDIKVNLSVGAYRDDSGKPRVLDCVRKAEDFIISQRLDKEYIPIIGLDSFNQAAIKFAYGENSAPLKENRIAVAQSLSGTGSLRVAASYIQRFMGSNTTILVPKPTWGNHLSVFHDAGLKTTDYRYLNKSTNSLDIQGFLSDIEAAPNGSVILLHGCAHNPTGVDPSPEQWKQIMEVSQRKKFVNFFDVAYQGFASGDPHKDAYSLRLFTDNNLPIILAQSFAKNMGLYGERIGAVSIVCNDVEEKNRVLSQMKILIRPLYSSPPISGARIAERIFNDPSLNKEWLTELKGMADRIIEMRSLLKSHLVNDFNSKLNWDHITSQIGMFCFTGMTPEQVVRLRDEFHIYLTSNGRISVAGVNSKNVRYIAESFHKVTQ